MKLMSIILSFAILFAGCYSNTTVTKDRPNTDNEELTFTLLWMKQGAIRDIYNRGEAYIISKQYHRIENGYEVMGTLVTPTIKSGTDFSGILYDNQIKEVAFIEYHETLTWIVTGGVVLVVAAIVALVAESHENTYPPPHTEKYIWGKR
jgi:hypothetical protein